MVCQRCRGLLVYENLLGAGTNTDATAIRCINCGCIEDAVVRANRGRASVGAQATRRGKVMEGGVACIKIHSEGHASIR